MRNYKTINILGINVDKVTEKEALTAFESFLEEDRCSQIITLNPEMIIEAQNNKEFYNLLLDSELAFPDGVGLVYASKIKHEPLEERVTGIDFTRKALELLASKGGAAYFLGAKPGIAEAAARNMEKEIQGLRVVGARDGYFNLEDEAQIIDEINDSGADFLCLALGAPKQELFIYKYKEQLKCKVAIGIGGSFDVWSGTLKRAPQFYINNNIEWLYRLIQEPSRIGRMAKLPVFLLKVAMHKEK